MTAVARRRVHGGDLPVLLAGASPSGNDAQGVTLSRLSTWITPGAEPGGVFGLAAFGPGGHGACQPDLTTGDSDLDVLGVQLRVTRQRSSDLRLGLGR